MSETRGQIIILGTQLIRTKGYHGFSYADIAIPLNIRNAAIHYHFPTKCDLGIAILENEQKNFWRNVYDWSTLLPIDQLENFIDLYAARKEEGQVCIMGALSPAVKTLPEPLQQKVSELGENILSWLSDLLEKGKKTGDFTYQEPTRTKAYLMISSLLSSLLLEQVLQNNTFETIKKGLLESVI